MVAPNLQNLPRGDDSDVQKWVKQMFVAPAGWTFWERDFSGIEAVIVGVHATSRDYYRLAKIDVHSYYTAFRLNSVGKLPTIDLPDLKWSDDDLIRYLSGIKKRWGPERTVGKRCIHAGNYRVGPKVLHESYPIWFPRQKDAAMALGLYYEVFPAIPAWHERICKQVDKTCWAKNSFGHIHRFYHILSWKRRGTEWIWDYGDDAKRLIAFGPQSDAAFIGKRALKTLYNETPVRADLRLFIHDSILGESRLDKWEEMDYICKTIMEQPVQELPLPASWNLGSHCKIGTEGKHGTSWGDMR
jgi:DNA polymerase I-like protein with 3'-5' exonuclease and polymerase domains